MNITSLSWAVHFKFPKEFPNLPYLSFGAFLFIALFSFVFKTSFKLNLDPLHRQTWFILPHIPVQTHVLASECKHSSVSKRDSLELCHLQDGILWANQDILVWKGLSERRVSGMSLHDKPLTAWQETVLAVAYSRMLGCTYPDSQ